MSAELDPIRALDRARAAQLVAAQVTRDEQMLAGALEATLSDDWGFGECGSLLNVIRALSEDLATLMMQTAGVDGATAIARQYLAEQLAAVEE